MGAGQEEKGTVEDCIFLHTFINTRCGRGRNGSIIEGRTLKRTLEDSGKTVDFLLRCGGRKEGL